MGSNTFPSGSRAERGSMAWDEQSNRSFNEGRAQPGRKNQKEVVTIFNSSSNNDPLTVSRNEKKLSLDQTAHEPHIYSHSG